MTAVRLPLNKGPSQCGQYATPLFLYSASPGTLTLRQRAPVERMTERAFKAPPLAICTSIRPPGAVAGMIFSARCKFMMSTS